jgi:hypothetical protein
MQLQILYQLSKTSSMPEHILPPWQCCVQLQAHAGGGVTTATQAVCCCWFCSITCVA